MASVQVESAATRLPENVTAELETTPEAPKEEKVVLVAPPAPQPVTYEPKEETVDAPPAEEPCTADVEAPAEPEIEPETKEVVEEPKNVVEETQDVKPEPAVEEPKEEAPIATDGPAAPASEPEEIAVTEEEKPAEVVEDAIPEVPVEKTEE